MFEKVSTIETSENGKLTLTLLLPCPSLPFEVARGAVSCNHITWKLLPLIFALWRMPHCIPDELWIIACCHTEYKLVWVQIKHHRFQLFLLRLVFLISQVSLLQIRISTLENLKVLIAQLDKLLIVHHLWSACGWHLHRDVVCIRLNVILVLLQDVSEHPVLFID